jgi:hypothetical protein
MGCIISLTDCQSLGSVMISVTCLSGENMYSKLLLMLVFLTLLSANVAKYSTSQVTSTCTEEQKNWFRDRHYSTDQENSLCRSGFEFTKIAATISLRSNIQKRIISEVVTVPISTPINSPLSIAGAAYCSFVPNGNALEAIVLLVSPGGSPPEPLSDQDCTATAANISSRRPEVEGVARIQLQWIPWKLQLRLTEGIMKLPSGATSTLEPFSITELATDAVKIALPDGVMTYRAAFFFSSSLTLAFVPDSAGNLSLPATDAVVPELEEIPDARDLNTTIRLPEKAIDNVVRAFSQARYTFPTGNPRIGDLTLSNFAWTQADGAPLIKATITDADGHSFNASISLGSKILGWLAVSSATLEAVEKPCVGNAISVAACRFENQALHILAPFVADAFLNRYNHTPIKPFSTERVFPFMLGNKKLQFQGLLYGLLAYPHSADLIMYCQFAIGELP